ncbi:sulfatase-like hydrolase/transferase [Pseudoalteromonas sp. B137]
MTLNLFAGNRVSQLILLVLGFYTLCLSGFVESKQPNILWIITDDQRSDSVSAYNQAVYGQNNSPLGYVESPNIDKLAAEGVLFPHAFTNSPVCGPSRGSMHSGRYPFRNGHYALTI